MPVLSLVLLLFISLLLFATGCGILARAGYSVRLPRASAIIAFTLPFIGYLPLSDPTRNSNHNMMDKRVEYTVEAAVLLYPHILDTDSLMHFKGRKWYCETGASWLTC